MNMSQTHVTQRVGSPVVVEGTPEEIVERLKTVSDGRRLTLIIPGDIVTADDLAPPAGSALSQSDMTFRSIFGSSQEGFDHIAMTDDELAEFLEDEVKAHRAEQGNKEPQGD
jgi:hypothetical protein